jgi:hypothetical protein
MGGLVAEGTTLRRRIFWRIKDNSILRQRVRSEGENNRDSTVLSQRQTGITPEQKTVYIDWNAYRAILTGRKARRQELEAVSLKAISKLWRQTHNNVSVSWFYCFLRHVSVVRGNHRQMRTQL